MWSWKSQTNRRDKYLYTQEAALFTNSLDLEFGNKFDLTDADAR